MIDRLFWTSEIELWLLLMRNLEISLTTHLEVLYKIFRTFFGGKRSGMIERLKLQMQAGPSLNLTLGPGMDLSHFTVRYPPVLLPGWLTYIQQVLPAAPISPARRPWDLDPRITIRHHPREINVLNHRPLGKASASASMIR